MKPSKNAKSNLKYAQKKITALPDSDPYKSIFLDIYRAVESIRHLQHHDRVTLDYKLEKKIEFIKP